MSAQIIAIARDILLVIGGLIAGRLIGKRPEWVQWRIERTDIRTDGSLSHRGSLVVDHAGSRAPFEVRFTPEESEEIARVILANLKPKHATPDELNDDEIRRLAGLDR